MIDIDYYRKIQNAYGAKTLRDAQKNQVKQDLNRDFNNTLDAYTVAIDGIEQDLTILKTNDSHVKKIKSRPNENFNVGQIVYWMDSYWLIKEVDTNNDIITHGKMVECNFTLYWQDSLGNILSRYVYVEDFTKYSNGETGNSTITIGDNQYGVYIQIDEDTKKLKRGMRFAFDFEDSDEPDIYSLTNRKVNLYNYESIQKGGLILLTFSFNAFNADLDKKITLEDGKQVWICNYRSTSTPSTPDTPTEPTEETTVSIVGSDTLRIGKTKTWTVELKDKDRNDVEVDDWKWNIKADFDTSKLTTQETDFEIKITAQDDDSLVDESFLLQILSSDGTVLVEKEVSIIEGF